MNDPGPRVDDLRRHLDAGTGGAAAGPDCPSPEEWWKGWRGDLDDAAFGRIVDHAAGCAHCALLSRVARELVLRLEPNHYRGVARPAPWKARLAFVAAAAAVVAVVGLTVGPWRGGRDDSEIRTQEYGAPASLLDETTILPRADCRLRWSAGPAGTVYQVEVTDEAMRSIDSIGSLTTTEVSVPSAALASIPAGGRIVWQVEAILPDGRRLASKTFFNRLD